MKTKVTDLFKRIEWKFNIKFDNQEKRRLFEHCKKILNTEKDSKVYKLLFRVFTSVLEVKKELEKVAVKKAIIDFIDVVIREEYEIIKKCPEFRKISDMLELEER